MPKNVEDIVPPRRSIRDIPVPEGRRRPIAPPREPDIVVPNPPEPPRSPTPPRQEYMYVPPSAGRKGFRRWVSVMVVLIIIAFAALSLFNGATLSYTPRTAVLSFNNDVYAASKTADPGSGKLPFSVIQLDGSKSASAPASGTEQASIKSSGTIIVYNNYSADPQKLIANTRFQSTDGKIYRIKTGIVVPGKKTVNGTAQPGSIETTVYADQPGPDYNIGLSDFTLPGLKDSPQYSAVYARSKTAMTGGFVGTRGKVSEADLTKAKSLLDGALKDELISQARAQVPADFVLFPDLSQVVYDTPTSGSSTETQVVISEHANLTAVMFKKTEIAAFLAMQKVDKNAPGGQVEIPDFSGLQVTSSGTKPDLLTATSVNFQVSGTAQLVWITDENSLLSDVAGKNKSTLQDILKNYPSIESASAVVRPFWKSSFPADPKKIKIVKNATK